MNKIIKKTQTILFAFLIAAMILPFSGMQSAEAIEPSMVYNPSMIEYIEKVISKESENTEERTVGDQTMIVTTDVKILNDNTYRVKHIVKLNGELKSKELFKIISLEDGNYQLVNKKLGIDEIYTLTETICALGWGTSNNSGASIRLYDGEAGTPNTVNLYDSYSACRTLNQAVMDVNVSVPTVDVTWEASPYYLDGCFSPHLFDHAIVTHGSQTYEFQEQTERQGSHAFTNTIGKYGWYSISINFLYGDW